jgi:hypothetical protein
MIRPVRIPDGFAVHLPQDLTSTLSGEFRRLALNDPLDPHVFLAVAQHEPPDLAVRREAHFDQVDRFASDEDDLAVDGILFSASGRGSRGIQVDDMMPWSLVSTDQIAKGTM